MTMSRDGYNNFIDTGSHLKFQPGPVILTTQREMQRQLLGVIRSATRQVSIWSGNIHSGLFEHGGFLEVLKRFVLSVRQARVRILLLRMPEQDEKQHPLLLLAERLPGTFEVRIVEHGSLDAAELIVVDDCAVLYRIHGDRWDGMSDINDHQVARFYLAQFNGGWRTALPTTPLAHAVE
jgi:hypothetical protein